MMGEPERWRRAARGWGVAVLCGALVSVPAAFFVEALRAVTALRERQTALVLLLPLIGFALGWVLERASVARQGTGRVLRALHPTRPARWVPLSQLPLSVLGTLATHLGGGSAGREGTAMQLGGAIGAWLGRALKLRGAARREVLLVGVAAGFAGVFGTPLAAAVLAIEWIEVGRPRWRALPSALLAALSADALARALGAEHTHFTHVAHEPMTAWLALRWIALALVLAALVRLFLFGLAHTKRRLQQLLPRARWRLAAAGAALATAACVFDLQPYLGLGLAEIERAQLQPAPWSTPALKLVTSWLTLGGGFVGGEVTPLFYLGATTASALAPALELPLALAAAVGLAATFGAAANVPCALVLMAGELFGAEVLPHAALVCWATWMLSGARSLYPEQGGLDRKLELPWPWRRGAIPSATPPPEGTPRH